MTDLEAKAREIVTSFSGLPAMMIRPLCFAIATALRDARNDAVEEAAGVAIAYANLRTWGWPEFDQDHMTDLEAKAREIVAALLNPEPHPLQEEWSDGHSMSLDTLVERLATALREARNAALEEAAGVADAVKGEAYAATNEDAHDCAAEIASRIRSLANKGE